MADEKSWFRDMSAKAVAGILVAVFSASGLAAVVIKGVKWTANFLAEPRYLPTWGFIALGILYLITLLWALFERLEKEQERMADVPIMLIRAIQDKALLKDLRKGRIRVQDGKVYYSDLWRRRELVPGIPPLDVLQKEWEAKHPKPKIPDLTQLDIRRNR